MVNIGIVGCGTIGSRLARYIQKDLRRRAHLGGICDVDREKAYCLSKTLKPSPPVLIFDKLIRRVDLVVEAATKEIAAQIAQKAIAAGRDILIMSVGAMLGQKSLFERARRKGVRIYIPSGAICGLDGVKAAALGKITRVTLTTRKPPKSLVGAPYLVEKKIDLDAIKKETIIFEGSALDAVKGFPKNINVSAALSLAGIGAEATRVRVVTSPGFKTNSHQIEVEGEFGKLVTRTDNVPSPDNPRTSYLAVLSAMATLKQVVDSVRVGT